MKPTRTEKEWIKFPVAVTRDQYNFLEEYVQELRQVRRGWSKAAVVRVAIEVLRQVEVDAAGALRESDLLEKVLRQIGAELNDARASGIEKSC